MSDKPLSNAQLQAAWSLRSPPPASSIDHVRPNSAFFAVEKSIAVEQSWPQPNKVDHSQTKSSTVYVTCGEIIYESLMFRHRSTLFDF